MPPKKVKSEKNTDNKALMAAVRDSNRWGELQEQKDYQDSQREFASAYAGIESASRTRDTFDRRVRESKPPTKSKKGQKSRRYGSLAWVEGEVYPQRIVTPQPFYQHMDYTSKDFRPKDRKIGPPHPRGGTEMFSLNSHGPRVDPDDLDNVYDGFGAGVHRHSEMGVQALGNIPQIQQTLLDLPLARSAAVNSVLDYVLESHAPKTSR